MTHAQAPESRQPLDSEQVAQWLARHPDFFVGREALLQQLHVPHPQASGVVSLLERLVHDLRNRAEESELRLEQLLDTARHNEVQYRRTRELVLALVEAQDCDALSQALATQLAERFHTPAVALWMCCETAHQKLQPPSHRLDEPTEHRLAALLKGRTSRCVRLSANDWRCLLPHVPSPVTAGSAALTRLTLGEPLGYLVLASPDSEHFRASLDTLFTEYLGDILARLLHGFSVKTRTSG